MKIIFTPQATRSLYNISDFVESKNTPGSGKRYALKFRKAIERLGKPNVQYAICDHPSLAQFNYSCAHFNDWVIAFRIENNKELVVHRIVHSALLA